LTRGRVSSTLWIIGIVISMVWLVEPLVGSPVAIMESFLLCFVVKSAVEPASQLTLNPLLFLHNLDCSLS
jgi:hypothetical protein